MSHEHRTGAAWRRPGRAGSLAVCVFVFVFAAAAAVGTALALEGQPLWLVILAADVAATVAVFAGSMVWDNSSLYDPYWSLAPLPIVGFLLSADGLGDGDPVRQIVVSALVTLWALRLTWNWWRGWGGLHHEDWRYGDLRRKTGAAWPLVSFLGVHFFPTLLVYAGCLSLIPALARSGAAFGALDIVAALVTLGAIACEAVADQQLLRFVASRPPRGTILDTGLWARSRHPNYLGELSFWWGLWLFALAADPASWWLVVGPVAMTVLFMFISIPMIERRARTRRTGWDEYAARVPALLPRLFLRR